MAGSKLLIFTELAEQYDLLYSWKDYGGESTRLEGIARRYGRPGRTTWLDVACGTGRHLQFLSRTHSSVGLDASREMLRVARRRLRGVRLMLGDMRTFRLDRKFDVVSCLFSAIGHLSSESDVLATFSNFARHLRSGGVAIVEPWIEPSGFLPGMIHLVSYQGPKSTVVRLASSSRRGRRSFIHYHYLVGRRGHGIRSLEETDVGLMVPRERLLSLLDRAGFDSRFLSRGLTGKRGLLVGVKREGPDTTRVR